MGIVSPTECASVSAISLRHILASPGTIAVSVTWMERGFNADQTHRSIYTPIYLRPFTSYSEILVGDCNFFLLLAFNAPVWCVPIGIPGKSLVLRKLESWSYQAIFVWQFDDRLSRFDTIPACDRRTDGKPISITCAVILTHVKTEEYLLPVPSIYYLTELSQLKSFLSILPILHYCILPNCIISTFYMVLNRLCAARIYLNLLFNWKYVPVLLDMLVADAGALSVL